MKDNPHGGRRITEPTTLTVAEWLDTIPGNGLYAFVRDGDADRRVQDWDIERDAAGVLQRVIVTLSGDRRRVLDPSDLVTYRAPASTPPPPSKLGTLRPRRVPQRTLHEVMQMAQAALARPNGGLGRQETREALALLERIGRELDVARTAERRAAEAEQHYARIAEQWNDGVCVPMDAAGIEVYSSDGDNWVANWRGVEIARAASNTEVTAAVIRWLVAGRS